MSLKKPGTKIITALKNGDPNDFWDHLTDIPIPSRTIPYSTVDWQLGAKQNVLVAPLWAILVNLSQEII